MRVKVLGQRWDSRMEEENREQLCPCGVRGEGGQLVLRVGTRAMLRRQRVCLIQ